MLYSLNGSYPIEMPFRIRLSSGLTRTDPSTFTSEEISDAGFVPVDDPPTVTKFQNLLWNGTSWVVTDKSEEQITNIQSAEINEAWINIREMRDRLIAQVEWKILRHQGELRLGLPLTDPDITYIDTYIQQLRDVTKQADPLNIVWPMIGNQIVQP